MRRPVLTLLFLLLAVPAFAGQHYSSQKEFRFAYAYGSAEAIPRTDGIIPATCHKPAVRFGPDYTQNASIGVSYSYFVTDDLSIDGGGFMPLGAPGAENLGLSGGVSYFLGNFFLPAELGYRGDLDTLTATLGVGYEYVFKNSTAVRVEAGPQYLADHDIKEEWAWKAEAAFGWTF